MLLNEATLTKTLEIIIMHERKKTTSKILETLVREFLEKKPFPNEKPFESIYEHILAHAPDELLEEIHKQSRFVNQPILLPTGREHQLPSYMACGSVRSHEEGEIEPTVLNCSTFKK